MAMYRCPVVALLLWALAAGAERVEIVQRPRGQFKVVSELSGAMGVGGTINGAGGWGRLATAKAYGADAMRTWHVTDLDNSIPEAEEYELKISAGIWLTHDGSRYENCSDMDADPFWQSELADLLDAVREFKNSSAILWWTVGNEVELEVAVTTGTDCLWQRVDWVAKAVKEEDPDHPVGTVLAGAHAEKVRNIVRLCESLEFLGINTYGDASLTLGPELWAAGWHGAYVIAEYGPTGHWEAPLTVWDSYIEESSTEKVPRYNATCTSCQNDPRCIGSFAFVWGWKWEKTGTWYGMFNEWSDVTENVSVSCGGCESQTVSVVEECWTGAQRKNPAPSLLGVDVDGQRLPGMRFSVEPDRLVPLHVEASHPQERALTALWAVTEEIVSDAVGGAHEDTNPLLSGLWNGTADDTAVGLDVVLDTSDLPLGRNYRLYVFVREDPEKLAPGQQLPSHEASATLPFRTCRTAPIRGACGERITLAMNDGAGLEANLYPGVNESSGFAEFQMLFYQLGLHSCDMPCGLEEWCHTAASGERCHDNVTWVLSEGIDQHPDLASSIRSTATLEEVQMFLHKNVQGLCPRPCAGAHAVFSEPTEDEKDTRRDIHRDVKPSEEGPGQPGTASGSDAAHTALALLLVPMATSAAQCSWH